MVIWPPNLLAFIALSIRWLSDGNMDYLKSSWIELTNASLNIYGER